MKLTKGLGFTRTFVRSVRGCTPAAAMCIIFVMSPVAARAQSACPASEAAWFTRVASGDVAAYGFAADGTIQTGKGASSQAPISVIGAVKLLGTSAISDPSGASISGTASGTEIQNVGGQITTLTFQNTSSSFTFHTSDCMGTLTRTLSNGDVVVWRIVVVDADTTIRFMDTRANPAMRTGTLQLMQ